MRRETPAVLSCRINPEHIYALWMLRLHQFEHPQEFRSPVSKIRPYRHRGYCILRTATT